MAAVENLDRAGEAAEAAGLPFVHIDPGVGYFGAANRLHRAGDTFVELLGEKDDGSPVGRHLRRLAGDGGYMVIIQVDDLDHHLGLAAAAGIRVVWQGGVEGIRGAHLHPADVGGAILSLDEADPVESWPWCGPDWTGGSGDHDGSPIDAISITSADPEATAATWAGVLDVPPDGPTVRLDATTIEFTAADNRPDRLVAAHVPCIGDHNIGGLRLWG